MNLQEYSYKLLKDSTFSSLEECVCKYVINAYADSHKELNASRNLEFFCKTPVKGLSAIEIAGYAIRSYNKFDQDAMSRLVEFFGQGSDYFFAREGSVCIYVKPQKHIWLNPEYISNLKCDEFSFNGNLGMFRVWFD